MSENTSWITEMAPMTVSVMPPNSRFSPAARAAAAAAGVGFVPFSAAPAPGIVARLLVLEVPAGKAPPARSGGLVIAITERTDLDCYESIRPDLVPTQLARAIRALVREENLKFRVNAERETIQVLNEIGYALSASTDRAALLETVLTHTRRAVRADSGTIYLADGDTLRFAAHQSDTPQGSGVRRGDLRISAQGFVSGAAANKEVRNIRDALAAEKLASSGAPPVRPPWAPDEGLDGMPDYKVCSAIAVPLLDRENQLLGVLALYNHKSQPDVPLSSWTEVTPFAKRHSDLLRSIASQVTVALENYRLYADIRTLFDGFVKASVSAIEARDPSTGGHSQRVAELTTLLAKEVARSSLPAFEGIQFSAQELTELHYASLLHDFGKVGVRERVLLKAEKLHPDELEAIETRFRVAALEVTLLSLRENLHGALLKVKLLRLEDDLLLVRKMNAAGRASERDQATLAEVAARWHVQGWGARGESPVVGPASIRRLSIQSGTLDPDERREIESHVEHTYRFLKIIPWTRDLRNVPEIARSHHEKLDGTGYPRGIPGAEIVYGAKLMAITDIWDALTAKDRPYKTAMSVDRALGVLRAEADAGKILGDAVELFATERVWEKTGG